jgi:hypothetical protein
MPPAVGRIYELARQTLDAVIDHWDVDAEPLPAKRYVSNGIVIWDQCDQLAVEVERTFGIDGNVADEQIDGSGVPIAAMRAVGVVVWVIRCVHDIDTEGENIVIPAADEMESDAMMLLADPTSITNAVVAAYKAGELGVCQGVALEGAQSQGPEGGYAGWAVRLRLALI